MSSASGDETGPGGSDGHAPSSGDGSDASSDASSGDGETVGEGGLEPTTPNFQDGDTVHYVGFSDTQARITGEQLRFGDRGTVTGTDGDAGADEIMYLVQFDGYGHPSRCRAPQVR